MFLLLVSVDFVDVVVALFLFCVGWLTGWLVGCLVDWLVGWLVLFCLLFFVCCRCCCYKCVCLVHIVGMLL